MHLGKIIDQLMYNQLYAPDFPKEDQTSLERQEALLHGWLSEAILAAAKTEDIGDWLRLGKASVEAAFQKFRMGDNRSARKKIEKSIGYLRNASSRKAHKRDFIAKTAGTIKSN